VDQPDQHEVARAEQTFSDLYHSHGREVLAIAYARCLDSELSRDLMQEAFLRLWRVREKGEVIENVRGWLLRVVRNLAEDDSKSAFRRNGTQPSEWIQNLRNNDVQPIDKMERDEKLASVREVLLELAPADRDILTLRYALDYETPEIASTLGIQPSAVHMRLTRARQRLAEKLIALGVDGKS
jgi:RNA polymerase sigma-70 factor, ECF subfamily